MAKHRSRRLRKKLHIGEFQELGFLVEVSFKEQVTSGDMDAFLDALLAEAIEPRRLAYGGSARGGFIAHEGRGSVTESDREGVLGWVRARKEVRDAKASGLVDAWYHVEETGDVL